MDNARGQVMASLYHLLLDFYINMTTDTIHCWLLTWSPTRYKKLMLTPDATIESAWMSFTESSKGEPVGFAYGWVDDQWVPLIEYKDSKLEKIDLNQGYLVREPAH